MDLSGCHPDRPPSAESRGGRGKRQPRRWPREQGTGVHPRGGVRRPVWHRGLCAQPHALAPTGSPMVEKRGLTVDCMCPPQPRNGGPGGRGFPWGTKLSAHRRVMKWGIHTTFRDRFWGFTSENLHPVPWVWLLDWSAERDEVVTSQPEVHGFTVYLLCREPHLTFLEQSIPKDKKHSLYPQGEC